MCAWRVRDHRSVTVAVPHIEPEHVAQFRNEGFFVLESVLPPRDLEALRAECRRLVLERDREMDRLGVDRIDLDHRGSRYFIHAYGESAAVERFLFSGLMARIARGRLWAATSTSSTSSTWSRPPSVG